MKLVLRLACIVAFSGLPVFAHAQQTTLCTALITDNPENPAIDGVIAVSETFPVSGSGDYTRAWVAYIDGKYAHKLQRTSQCSNPAESPAMAAQGRLNFIYKWEAGFKTDLSPWRPATQTDAATNESAQRDSDVSGTGQREGDRRDDNTGIAASSGSDRRPGVTQERLTAPTNGTGQRPSCVTQPFDAPNTAFPKGSARKITNTCKEPLSVRICLRIDGKWDCGVNWNVGPGAEWSWGSTKVYTSWFWDARLASSRDQLAHPEN